VVIPVEATATTKEVTSNSRDPPPTLVVDILLIVVIKLLPVNMEVEIAMMEAASNKEFPAVVTCVFLTLSHPKTATLASRCVVFLTLLMFVRSAISLVISVSARKTSLSTGLTANPLVTLLYSSRMMKRLTVPRRLLTSNTSATGTSMFSSPSLRGNEMKAG